MTHILETLAAAGARSFPEVRKLLEASPLCLRVTEGGDLYGLRYQKAHSDLRSAVVRQARGIVLEKETNRIVSWAFDKFYEYGESAPSYSSRPNLRRSVQKPGVWYERKYDGVLIKVVRRSGQLLVSTNGRIDAATAPILKPSDAANFAGYSIADADIDDAAERHGRRAAGAAAVASGPLGVERKSLRQAFEESGGLALPYEENLCYAFELLHGDVLTVVPTLRAPSLVHLMTRRMGDGYRELPLEGRFEVGSTRPSEVVRFPSFGACRAAARLLPWDDEGFVMADGTGMRIKVKSDAFKAMQRLLVGDFEVEEHDAACVALTLGRATTPLPASQAELVGEWRRRCEVFAESCLARLAALQQRGGPPAGSATTARGARIKLEAALGGRMPQEVRAVLARALDDRLRPSAAADLEQPLDAEFVLAALRSGGLSLAAICGALRLEAARGSQQRS